MSARVTIRDDREPLMVDIQLENALREAADEAREQGRLGAIQLEAHNGDPIVFVVGGEETVLGFNCGRLNPLYYASRGSSEEDYPLLTCYLNLKHHTGFPRRYVIPIQDGITAVQQFVDSGDVPTCIHWEEV